MLASQVTSASQVAKLNFFHQATVAHSTAILRSIRLLRRCRNQQQVRSFRIGLWSSYLDPAFQKELQRRHRIIKHKYVEALNRKLSWDRRLPIYPSSWGLKGLMCSSWRAHDPRHGGGWVNVDESREVRDSTKPTSHHGIEDVEQDAFNELFKRMDALKLGYLNRKLGWNWTANESTTADPDERRPKKMPEAMTKETLVSQYSGGSIETTATASEQEYDIDPISNRKVYKNKTKLEGRSQGAEPTVTEIPVKTFKGYRSPISEAEPLVRNPESKVIHLGSGGVSSANRPIQLTAQAVQDEASKYKPFKYNEPDGKLPDQGDAATERMRQHDHLYQPFKYNELDGKLPEKPDSVSASLSDFDYQYKPFEYNELDGKFPEQSGPVEKALNNHDQQIGGKPRPSTTSISSRTDSRQPKTSESSSQCSDSSRYQSSVSWLSEEGFSTKTGLGPGKQAAAHLCEQSQTTQIEPSLNRSLPPELTTFSDANAEKRADPDSLRAPYIPAASDIFQKSGTEIQAKIDTRRKALEADFDRIQFRESLLADEIAAAQKVKASRKLAQDLEIERSYLLNHNAHARGRVEAKIMELDAEVASAKALSDTEWKMTGNFVRDFPEEFSGSWSPEGSSSACLVPKNDTASRGHDRSPNGLKPSYQQEAENAVQSAENDCGEDATSREVPSHGAGSTNIEPALQRLLRDPERKAQDEQDPYTKEPIGLEISYAEEVKAQSSVESPLLIKSYGCEKKPQQDKELVRSIRNIYESTYGIIDCNHRQPESKKEVGTSEQDVNQDGLRVTAQNLKQKSRERHHQAEQRFIDGVKVSKKPSSEEGSALTKGVLSLASKEPSETASPIEPTLYKILAYDPITQTIKTAETTSIVTDTSPALTPAKVLLRLSNPAKFLPHFQSLHSQGYEIASGSGDVLVFRKVHESTRIKRLQVSEESTVASVPQGRKVVNPIDGMEGIPRPATGNFASPTGFVNHDLPSEPPFISGIDVRREEPVFSGRKNEWQDGEVDKEEPGRKSRKIGRGLLVGAAWVAACSYAVGVVAEFFKTGGSDGKGPIGF